MKVKVFTTNSNDKIEFTREELETLLNEVWQDGYEAKKTYSWTSPTITSASSTPIWSGDAVYCTKLAADENKV